MREEAGRNAGRSRRTADRERREGTKARTSRWRASQGMRSKFPYSERAFFSAELTARPPAATKSRAEGIHHGVRRGHRDEDRERIDHDNTTAARAQIKSRSLPRCVVVSLWLLSPPSACICAYPRLHLAELRKSLHAARISIACSAETRSGRTVSVPCSSAPRTSASSALKMLLRHAEIARLQCGGTQRTRGGRAAYSLSENRRGLSRMARESL